MSAAELETAIRLAIHEHTGFADAGCSALEVEKLVAEIRGIVGQQCIASQVYACDHCPHQPVSVE